MTEKLRFLIICRNLETPLAPQADPGDQSLDPLCALPHGTRPSRSKYGVLKITGLYADARPTAGHAHAYPYAATDPGFSIGAERSFDPGRRREEPAFDSSAAAGGNGHSAAAG